MGVDMGLWHHVFEDGVRGFCFGRKCIFYKWLV